MKRISCSIFFLSTVVLNVNAIDDCLPNDVPYWPFGSFAQPNKFLSAEHHRTVNNLFETDFTERNLSQDWNVEWSSIHYFAHTQVGSRIIENRAWISPKIGVGPDEMGDFTSVEFWGSTTHEQNGGALDGKFTIFMIPAHFNDYTITHAMETDYNTPSDCDLTAFPYSWVTHGPALQGEVTDWAAECGNNDGAMHSSFNDGFYAEGHFQSWGDYDQYFRSPIDLSKVEYVDHEPPWGGSSADFTWKIAGSVWSWQNHKIPFFLIIVPGHINPWQ